MYKTIEAMLKDKNMVNVTELFRDIDSRFIKGQLSEAILLFLEMPKRQKILYIIDYSNNPNVPMSQLNRLIDLV